MLGNTGTYANKKRKKPVLKQKKVSEGNEVVKSNPSKRHRDRLNGELDRLTDLLPLSEEGRSRLDKLSVLRLSVGYLKAKSYFKAIMKNSSSSSLQIPGLNGQNGNSMDTTGFSEGDLLLQALNGFVIVVTSDGLVFYASSTIKEYLGFHQSDVVHQSVFDLIHTDDRDMFRQQLHFALNPPPISTAGNALQSSGNTEMFSPEHLPPENSSILERSFVCRFRCLLDNSSGFLALKFQGRLKFLHGQSVVKDNRTCNPPQLALFSIAMPVQSPSIVEIRAKMILFQTKHQLDFTPMSIDSRGKIILGYSETELCMKGSGYQFIHAADMMYCADRHLRMIKTGETGLTVFRLLSKSNSWVWVKSNAKLIFKEGRPEFIICYQKALVNTEGEDYLRQRNMQLPFSLTRGEAILYNTGPTVDVPASHFNKMFSNTDISKDMAPGSLLDCFLRQDEAVYTQTVEPPLPVDQVFQESRALVTIPSDMWQENRTLVNTDPVAMKAEAKQSVMAVIDNFEKMAQSGDFGAALQNLEVDNTELMEFKRLGQDEDQRNNISSELDSILTNDIFDYIDRVLFQEKGGDGPSSLCNNPQEPFSDAALYSATRLCKAQLFNTQSPLHTYSPNNGLYTHQQDPGQSLSDPAQILTSIHKLSHQGPLIAAADTHLPPLQQLQLQDIFSPSIELPDLVVPDAPAPFQSCGQVPISHMGGVQRVPAQTPFLPNNLPAPAMVGNGHMLQSSVKQPKNIAPGVVDILPQLIPCNDLSSSTTQIIPSPFAAACLQGSSPFEMHTVQQWPQGQQQMLPQSGTMQNGHQLMPDCHGQTSESQTVSRSGLWPRRVTGLNHSLQGGLACGQAVTHSSCMFEQHLSSSPAVGDMLALSGVTLDPSPLQGSCCFQWGCSEPVVGASTINQENGNIPSEHIQHYQENHRQTQDEKLSSELNGIFAAPPHDVAMYSA
ncbi:aryl hydrocarbon receptor-like [Limanda limanda]|uniref:aryl hydrocarbon receptor-like n=1 Tax=Limanda limanda TaxID=27771 RepID=UPI0029C61177|nr:aryl hydrocarbon receptor-like [Limanda limanda]